MLLDRRRHAILDPTLGSMLALVLACSEAPPSNPGNGTPSGGATSAGAAGDGVGGTRAGDSGSGGSSVAGSGGNVTSTGGAGTGGNASGGAGAGGNASAGGASAGSGGSSDGGTATAGGGAGGSSGTAGTSGGTSGGSGDAGASGAGGSAGSGGSTPSGPPHVFVFSRTAGYRHDAIPAALTALAEIGTERGWTLYATEDATYFTDANLSQWDVAVFLLTSDDALDAEQQAAFERFIRTPNQRNQRTGFVGIHSASATEYDWAFYGGLVGAFFREHPPGTEEARVVVEDATHPATASLPASWVRTDEWYAFRDNPRDRVTVLLSLDESSYSPGTAHMDGDHPIAWAHTFEGARSFHTALGHTQESYSDPLFRGHITAAIEWAAWR